jgi:hypothetical protein
VFKEINYNVIIEPKDSPRGTSFGSKYYGIASITAEVTISKNPVTAECGKKVGVN